MATAGFENITEADVNARNARLAASKGVKTPKVGQNAPQPPQQGKEVAIQETFALSQDRVSYRLVLPWPPSDNHYLGQRVVVSKNPTGKRKGFAMFYYTAEAKAFRAKAALIARESGMPMLKGKLLVALKFYFPTKAGDLQNREKVLLDVLQGIAYENDRQVTRRESERFQDKENPRAEITIQERE